MEDFAACVLMLMKKDINLKKILALVCAVLLLLPALNACGKQTGGDETSDADESTTLEQGPEIDLNGDSPLALLDRGAATPAVEIGPFKISSELIKTYLKWYVLKNMGTITERAAAYEIAALYYAERGLAGTEQALTQADMQAILQEQETDYEVNKENLVLYGEQLGLTKQEVMDMAAIGEINGLLSARFSAKVYDLMAQSYRNKHGRDGTADELSAYYPEYLQIFVRRLEFKEVNAGALETIRGEIQVWIADYVEG